MGVALYTEKTITGGKVGGVPGAMVTEQNGVRLFGCAKGGLATAFSKDGLKFTAESEKIMANACDPAVVKSAKGGFLMVYKVVEQKSGNYPTSQPQPSPSAP